MFDIIKDNKTYKVYSVRHDKDGETYFLIYDNEKKAWYWFYTCDCKPVD